VRSFLKGNAVAIVALVFAMTGTGIAASRYIITRASQIKPSARSELLSQAEAAAVAKKGAHAVVARARFSGEALSVSSMEGASVPLSGAAWTQSFEEVDQLVSGGATVTAPGKAECPHGGGFPAQGQLQVYLDGHSVAGAGFGTGEGPRTFTTSLSFQGFNGNMDQIYEPGTATKHTLEARMSDSCEGGTEHFVLRNLSMDVLGFR
jgi:hypothetical protein